MTAFPPFGVLVEAHIDELMRYARRLSGPDAEDVMQEALLKALRSYPRLRAADHLRAWLFRIVTTTAFDAGAKRIPVPVENLPDTSVEDGSDDGFYALLEGLRDADRKVLEMRYVHDMEYAQIARKLGCSQEAARQRVSSAVRSLRRRLP